jgi:phosphatidylinositol 4-kinase
VLAAALICFASQVKDRHNGNILIDRAGHLVHIDFGFILGASPAYNMNFESAPFKLTAEYVALLGGVSSPYFALFEDLFVEGYLALQRHIDSIGVLAEVWR